MKQIFTYLKPYRGQMLLGVLLIAVSGVCSLLLPTIMEFNMPTRIEKYGVIARQMGVDTTDMTPEEAAQAAVDAVRTLSIRVGIPQHLSDLGITEADIPALADQAIADVCTPGNPRPVTREDIVALYRQIL